MTLRSLVRSIAGLVAIAACGAVACAGCDRAQIVRRDAAASGGGLRVPERPETGDASGEERTYVLRDPILAQQPDRWRTLGWDLDGRCTAPPSDGDDGGGIDGGAVDGGAVDGGLWAGWDLECTPRRPSSAGPVIDGDECRDNAFGAYVSVALAALPTDVEEQASVRMARGEYAIFVRVRGYDGTEDDPLVEVDVWPTVYGAPAGGMRGDALRWDGTDELWLAREAFSSLEDDAAIIRDTQAYVAGGLLVMRVPTRVDFDFASDDVLLRMRITDATITGRIEPDPAAGLREVTISGRWPLADLFEQLPWLGLCPGDPGDEAVARLIRDGLEPAADVASEPVIGSAPLVPCEAASLAIGFTGYAARRGGVTSFERPPGVCPEAM